MNRPTAGPPSESANLLGYDLVRLAAMGCVAAQHALSISGIEPAPILHTVNLGQLGVTLFCALSGFFALRTSGDPIGWLRRRLDRVCLPYWISLAAIFTANGIVHYKPVTAGLVVSVFLGVAYFTHPGSLVGVHVWFMSLILVCYALGALIRWDRRLLPACVGITVLLIPQDPGLTRHVLSFLAGITVAVLSRPVWTALGLAVVGGAVAVRPEFAYPLAGTAALILGGSIRGRSPRAVARAGRASYEFFLVHGPVYLGLARLVGSSLLGIATIGTAAAIAATWALRRADRAVRCALAHGRPDPARRLAAPPDRRDLPAAAHPEVTGYRPRD